MSATAMLASNTVADTNTNTNTNTVTGPDPGEEGRFSSTRLVFSPPPPVVVEQVLAVFVVILIILCFVPSNYFSMEIYFFCQTI